MTSSLNRLSLALLAAFAALGLATGYWSLARSSELTLRKDNPRRFIAETRVRRGTILDRHGGTLAETRGLPGDYVRDYLLPEAAPVVGYASLRYGVSGVEEAANLVLRGEADRTQVETFWRANALGEPPIGRGVRLTLDSELQRAAAAALGRDTGAVVLLDALGGDVLAMVSSPTFDPNTLDADWESLVADRRAPLLNRATLGSYQPGGALQPILLAAALERGLALPDDIVADAGQPMAWNGGALRCDAPGSSAGITLGAAFALDCPAPFADLGSRLGPPELATLLADFGLFDAPEFPLPTAASARNSIAENPSDLRLAAAGLGNLRVSPLQMALVAAAFANHGTIPPLQLITATQNTTGQWTEQTPAGHRRSAIGASSANAVALLFPPSLLGRGVGGEGQAGGEIVKGHASLSLTGPNAERIAWYLGFAPANAPKYAVAVLVEHGTRQRAREVGETVLIKADGEK